MSVNTLLYELTHSEWLMDLRYLHQFRASLKSGSSQKQERDEKEYGPSLIEFYSENLQRLNPSNTAEIPTGAIAVIHVVGVMMKYGNWWVQGADEVVAQLDFANNIDNVAAIVLVVDGPGGAVSAIAPFIEFAQRKRKPIVGAFDSAYSLHWWILNAVCDYKMALNNISAGCGSVGVVTHWLDLTEYWRNLGVKEEEVYSDLSEHKNEVWRKIKENDEEGKKMLRVQLNDVAEKFQAAVKKGCPNLIEEEGTLSGRVFGSEKALSLNMINKIGTMQDAMNIAQTLSEVA